MQQDESRCSQIKSPICPACRIPDEWQPAMATFYKDLASQLYEAIWCRCGYVWAIGFWCTKVDAHKWWARFAMLFVRSRFRGYTIRSIRRNSECFDVCWTHLDEKLVNFSLSEAKFTLGAQIGERNSSAILRNSSTISRNSSAIFKSCSFGKKTFKKWKSFRNSQNIGSRKSEDVGKLRSSCAKLILAHVWFAKKGKANTTRLWNDALVMWQSTLVSPYS